VVGMSDFDFDLDAGNIVEVDFIELDLKLSSATFAVVNGGFESDTADPGTANPPAGWQQWPPEGVSKNLIAHGDAIYNASMEGLDPEITFVSYAGSNAIKMYGQNYYIDDVWQGPSQTGTIYQSFRPSEIAVLAPGAIIHARAAAKVYSADPLTGGSSFQFGFQYLNADGDEIGRDVTSLDSTASVDTWLALAANGTVPSEADRVQIIAEFVQTAASDAGAVYLDDVSVGLGEVPPTVNVGDSVYELVWSDEFDGTKLNTAHWTHDTGTGSNGWGNGETQIYTEDSKNLRVEDGLLVIEAHKEGSDWTSARIKTEGKRSFQYGKIEFRARLPRGIGPWPAAWMMGENITEVGWPASGEIDIMEWRGTQPSAVGHATHSPANHGGNAIAVTAPVTNPSDTFNTYAVVWEPGRVTFSVNGTTTGSWSTADTGDPFEQEFFILLNLAMGGSYVNYQIDPALSNARYEVDYVRVYQKTEAAPVSGFEDYLISRGLSKDLPFDAEVDGIPVGMAYAFGGASPRLGIGPATLIRMGDSLTYTFDIRDDENLGIILETSEDLVHWESTDYSLSSASGAAEGFVRQALTADDLSGERFFLRISVDN